MPPGRPQPREFQRRAEWVARPATGHRSPQQEPPPPQPPARAPSRLRAPPGPQPTAGAAQMEGDADWPIWGPRSLKMPRYSTLLNALPACRRAESGRPAQRDSPARMGFRAETGLRERRQQMGRLRKDRPAVERPADRRPVDRPAAGPPPPDAPGQPPRDQGDRPVPARPGHPDGVPGLPGQARIGTLAKIRPLGGARPRGPSRDRWSGLGRSGQSERPAAPGGEAVRPPGARRPPGVGGAMGVRAGGSEPRGCRPRGEDRDPAGEQPARQARRREGSPSPPPGGAGRKANRESGPGFPEGSLHPKAREQGRPIAGWLDREAGQDPAAPSPPPVGPAACRVG
jgi:hypothetical protein